MRPNPASPGRQPLPETVVTQLLLAGLSRRTVLAMEARKAQEVLDLLHSAHLGDGRSWAPEMRAPASDGCSVPGAMSPPAGPVLGFSTQD